ncbi:PLP-dependent aminotransferase family protein [Paraburkholderia sp. J67]|uniref:aminotransferase-like domain-containing protein n=1 Tax=Paraburkholderia sp. J67 TaxID=2805435 RepID=UPI002ABE4A3A|nr:PLP-dependent aminotransferase family protein [Paraburkholderia sp. J67]
MGGQRDGVALTRVEQVMETVRERIATRALAAGARVPSIRAMSEQMGVSKSTVVEAYERLVAEGAVAARRGSGFFVAGQAALRAQGGKTGPPGPNIDRAIDPLWLTRQSLETDSRALRPGCGWLPASWLPQDAVRRALRAIARDPRAQLTDYATPLGQPALRQQLAWRLGQHGIDAEPTQIMLTDGGSQALDLLCRFLLEPGDTVVVDDPCYFNFQALLRVHRVQVVSVPYTPTGPDLAAFERVLAAHRPRLYVTNSAIHNPTGATLAPPVAHRLLKLAEEHDLLIVEDDIFADFETDPAPRLAAFDGLARVVAIGSFSKTMTAAARCGYIAARADWIESLVDLKLAVSFGNGELAADLVQRLLVDGTYRRYLDGLRARLADSMGETLRRLTAAGLTAWTRPQAGMLLWAQLPGGLDAAKVAREALADGVVLAPGNVFSVAGNAGSYLRFNVSQCNRPKVYEVLQRAMERAESDKLRPAEAQA